MATTEIIYSMQNSIQKDRPTAAFRGINFHVQIAKNAGYDGNGKIEYFPFQVPSFQLRFLRHTDKTQINSSHESFGSGKLPDNIGMRGKIASLKDLVILQKNKPDIMSVV